MNLLFTLLSIDTGNKHYLISAKKLIQEILLQTKHDILLSTNNVEFFSDIVNTRLTVRNNIESSSIFVFNGGFNYNLKHHAFMDVPKEYDGIIYLDCDIKLDGWSDESDKYVLMLLQNYSFGADRTCCLLKDEVERYLTDTPCLFKHKIKAYEITEHFLLTDDIMNSRLPSEHFLVLKNEPMYISKFQKKWKELNDLLQCKNGADGAWGDGFEIGIAARYAGFHSILNVGGGDWNTILKFKFNGNKI